MPHPRKSSAGTEAAGGPVSLACSFSVEDVVIIDMAHELSRSPSASSPLTQAGLTRKPTKWPTPSRSAIGSGSTGTSRATRPWRSSCGEKGTFSFRESLDNRHECCHVRKVEPLGRALKGLAGWVTGLRREQSVTRTGLAPIELDTANGDILKINPLLEWSEEQVWDYAGTGACP